MYPQSRKKIKFELVALPSRQEKAAKGKSGFVPAIVRWVIERSRAWIERCKILVKNHERTKRECNHETQSLLRQVNDQETCSFVEMSNGFYNSSKVV